MTEKDSIRTIKGIGEKSEKLFCKLGVATVGELLNLYPREYEIYTQIQPVDTVREGQTAVIEGCLSKRPRLGTAHGLKIISCQMRDSSGQLTARWFNMPYLMKTLTMGKYYIFRGKIANKNGMLQMVQPKILSREEYANSLGKLLPVYPLTEGLTNHAVAKAVAFALKECTFGDDPIPARIRKEYQLISHKKAVKTIHFPESKDAYVEARNRLVFEEFFCFALELKQMRDEKQRRQSRFVFQADQKATQLLQGLPYTLTEAQKRAWGEIKRDMAGSCVMHRLLQGDVGSGKTILALLGLVYAAENGYQAAIMAPTEVLARQHYEEFVRLVQPLGTRVVLLTGSMTAAEKREARRQIEKHEADIIVGTHTLIQEKVVYDNLAFVVTDEQHRFGVRQREQFAKKGQEPHMLVMSATPIPRTLAMILYGDLDISVLDSMPAGRLPIQNCAVGTGYRKQAYHFIGQQIEKGHQAYIICPMVSAGETMEAENVMDYTESLKEVFPPSVRIAYLHGKMKPAEKNACMEQFARGDIDLLVSTTVIEVGINVPNATVMMIENAERFGLAQLHQLRGRVGRGSAQSYCIFMAGNTSKEAMNRLRVLEESNDGFEIAQKDLQMRGPGDLFGIRQSGDLNFKLADIYQDAKLLVQANEAAATVSQAVPGNW